MPFNTVRILCPAAGKTQNCHCVSLYSFIGCVKILLRGSGHSLPCPRYDSRNWDQQRDKGKLLPFKYISHFIISIIIGHRRFGSACSGGGTMEEVDPLFVDIDRILYFSHFLSISLLFISSPDLVDRKALPVIFYL